MSTSIADPAAVPNDARARRNVAVLVFAHAVLGSQLAINIMRHFKQYFDPSGILNPYKVLPQWWTMYA